jgi:tetratricopeptide (TPR) repeat protein
MQTHLLAVFCVAIACAGCSRAPARPSLIEVSLPDLARLDPSVQAQIKGEYAGLTRTRESAGVSDAQLGAAFGELGMLLHAAQYHDAADRAYRNAQALMPSDPRWPYYMALLRRATGDTAQAVALLNRTLELRPDDLPALVWLGRTHLDQGRLDQAEPLFARAQSVAPKTVAVLAGQAQIALARKDFTRAVSLLEEGLTIDPRADSLRSQLAAAYRGLGNTAQAEAQLKLWRNTEVQVPDPLREDLDLALESGLSYDLRGARVMAKGDYRGAAELFRRGVELTSGSTQLGRALRHKLGTALFLMGNTEEAIRQFEEVVRLAPSSGQDEPAAKAHYSLGIVRASSSRGPEAIAHFTMAVAFSPHYLEARIALGDALRAAGRPAAALEHYAEAVRIDPRAAEARFGYAMGLVRLRRYAAARDWLVESVRVQPDRPDLVHALARLLATAPDDDVRDGQRALAMIEGLLASFKTTYMGETLAMTLAELGQFDEAAAVQRSVLEAARPAGRQAEIRRMTANLALYRRRQPCRTPWPDDDPVHRPGPAAAQPAG